MENNKLSCFFSQPAEFTVGEIRDLKCKGSIPISLSAPLQIQFENDFEKYSLVVLETVKIEQENIDLKVTSYKVGNFDNAFFLITDGTQSAVVDNLSWKTISILKSESKQIQPYPSYGPWNISFSPWYLTSWIVLFLISLCFGYFQLKQIKLRKEIKQRISDRLRNQTPIQYFIQQLSQFFIGAQYVKEKDLFLKTLNQSLREFLENKFSIPLEDSVQNVLKSLKKKNLDHEQNQKISQIFLEFDKIKKNPSIYSKKDEQQLLGMVRDWIFEYEKKENKK